VASTSYTRPAQAAHAPQTKVRRSRINAFNLLATFITVLLAVIFAFPLYWAIASALKRPVELNVVPPLWFPPAPQWANFISINEIIPFYRFMWNTAVVTVLTTFGGVLSASLVGYGFSHFRFRGRHALFLIVLSTMMLPAEVTLIPTYLIFNELGWIDTFKPLVVPAFAGGGAFSIFLFRQFFASIPKELNDAAKIDGCNPVRFYRSILMPLSIPVTITLCILYFQYAWNDLMGPLIYLTSLENYTVSVGLLFLRTQAVSSISQRGAPTEHLLMAGSVISMAPALLLFFLLQRYFIRGVIMSGIKG
jgi:ABC-type glycerol-3-phosphate transport system permease component